MSANEITLRVNDRWLRFTPSDVRHNGQTNVPFTLTEDGNVCIDNGPPEEMDLAAERLAREMLHPPQ